MDPIEIIIDLAGILTVIVLFIIGLIYTCKQLRSMKKDRHSDLLMNLTSIWDSEHYRESRAIIGKIGKEVCERPPKTNGNTTKVYNKEDVTRKLSKKYCYLFSWDNVPGDGSEEERLLRYLKDDHDIVLAGDVEISKSDDNIIQIEDENLSATITLVDDEVKATLKIKGYWKCDLKVKKEDDKLNIYKYCFYDKLKEYKKKDFKAYLCIFGVPNFFENIGWLVKNGYIEDPHVIADFFGNSIVYYYDLFKEYINSSRDEIPDLYCYFEDLRDLVEDTRLLMFLVVEFTVGWAENAKIKRSDDGKTIRIFKGIKSAEIKIDEKSEKAILKINGKPKDINVKIERSTSSHPKPTHDITLRYTPDER